MPIWHLHGRVGIRGVFFSRTTTNLAGHRQEVCNGYSHKSSLCSKRILSTNLVETKILSGVRVAQCSFNIVFHITVVQPLHLQVGNEAGFSVFLIAGDKKSRRQPHCDGPLPWVSLELQFFKLSTGLPSAGNSFRPRRVLFFESLLKANREILFDCEED